MSQADDDFGFGVAVWIVCILILMGMAYYVSHNQAQSINDLQRRVGELEQKRNEQPKPL